MDSLSGSYIESPPDVKVNHPESQSHNDLGSQENASVSDVSSPAVSENTPISLKGYGNPAFQNNHADNRNFSTPSSPRSTHRKSSSSLTEGSVSEKNTGAGKEPVNNHTESTDVSQQASNSKEKTPQKSQETSPLKQKSPSTSPSSVQQSPSLEETNPSLHESLSQNPAILLQFAKYHLSKLRNSTAQIRPSDPQSLNLLHVQILALFNEMYQMETAVHKTQNKIRHVEKEYSELVGMVQREREEKSYIRRNVKQLKERKDELQKSKEEMLGVLKQMGIIQDETEKVPASAESSTGKSTQPKKQQTNGKDSTESHQGSSNNNKQQEKENATNGTTSEAERHTSSVNGKATADAR